jgi:hypothetical protein
MAGKTRSIHSSKAQSKKLWRTAVHEAGHVVAILAQGISFSRVSVKRDDTSLGHVMRRLSKNVGEVMQSGDLLASSRAVEPLVRIDLAGGIAVGIHCGVRGRWEGAGGDFLSASNNLLRVYGTDGPELQAHFRHLELQTTALLKSPGRRWQTVVIARALLEKPVMSREDVADALRRAPLTL